MAHTDHNSDQFANFEAEPRVANKDNEWSGRVRLAFFSFTSPTGGVASGETVALTKLPKGARVLHGRVTTDSANTSLTLDIGIDGDADKYAAALDIAAAGGDDFANTQALNMGTETTEEEDVIGTTGGAAMAADTVLKGFMLYAQN